MTATATARLFVHSDPTAVGPSFDAALSVTGVGSGNAASYGPGTVSMDIHSYQLQNLDFVPPGATDQFFDGMNYEFHGELAPGASLYFFMSGRYDDPYTGGTDAFFSNGEFIATAGAFSRKFAAEQPISIFLDNKPIISMSVNIALVNGADGGTSWFRTDPGVYNFQPQAVPEPASAVMMGTGALVLLGSGLFCSRRANA